MRYIPLMLLSMASRVATLCPKRLLRAKTGALRAAALHAASDDAAVIDDATSIYAIPERDVDEGQNTARKNAQHAARFHSTYSGRMFWNNSYVNQSRAS